MFTQQIGRNARRIGQKTLRIARAGQVRSYAAEGEKHRSITYTIFVEP